MANWLNEQLKAVGVETQLVDLGKQEIEGLVLELPPAILGRIGNDPKKKTILIYGHFDVQPVCSQAIISAPNLKLNLFLGEQVRRLGH